MTEREATIVECAVVLEARAESLERSGNLLGSYEARNCALAIRRLAEERAA